MITFRSSTRYILLLVSILVIATNINAQSNVVPDDIEFAVLKNIYDSLGGSGWTNKTNWPAAGSWPASATSAQFGTWQGVTVANGDITRLTLSSNNLTGQLPKTIGKLTKLTYAYLQSNAITGSIPASFGDLTSIQYLYLHQNQLSGSIPSEFGNLTTLSRLLLNNNNLSGEVPSSLGNIASLSQLYLNYNQLTGNVPATLGNLTNLVYLYLRNNQLSGSLPSTLGNLINLQHLSLNNNQLSGALPSTLANLSELLFVDISNNQFTGSLPNISAWNKVNQLQIGHNQLSGAFPASISSLPLLTILQAEFNSFTSLPSSLLGLPAITTIGFNENELVTVPNFSTHVNKGNLTLQLQKNRLDFSQLELLIGKGIKTFTYNPQKLLNDITYKRADPGSILLLPARSPGQNGSLVWERKLEGSSSWITVTAQNEDATQRTFKKSNMTTADDGLFRYRMTNTLFSGFAIESSPITVRVGREAIWNSMSGVNQWKGILTKTTQTGWGYSRSDSENTLEQNTDGWFEFVVDENSISSSYAFGFSSVVLDLTLPSIVFGIEINSQSGQKVYIHESSEVGIDMGTWAVGDVFKVERQGSIIRYYKNGAEIRSVNADVTQSYFIKSLIHTGKSPLTTASFWIPASRGEIPDAWEFMALKDLSDSTKGYAWNKAWPVGTSVNQNIVGYRVYGNAATMDTWYGVVTENGDIVALEVDANFLQGKIPAGISRLKKLRKLSLYGNYITSIPAHLSNLNNLEVLSLARNRVIGTIPASLGKLTKLTSLKLYSNSNLAGTFPDSLFNLMNLTELQINDTKIGGVISENIGKLTKLKILWLNSCLFEGRLPVSLGNATGLEELNLNENNIEGELPTSWSSLKNLRVFWAQWTSISGKIPGWIWDFTKMESLALGNTSMTGEMSPYIGNLTNLRSFYMDGVFYGTIPDELQNLTNLTEFQVNNWGSTSNGPLEGPIPESLLRIPTIKDIQLRGNNLTTLPDVSSRYDIGTISLDVSRNKISLEDIERYFTAAGVYRFKGFSYQPQQGMEWTQSINVSLNQTLKIEAPSAGIHGVSLWEKLVNGIWVDITAQNQSSVSNVFEISNVTQDWRGDYRYKVINSWASELVVNVQIQVVITDAPSSGTTEKLFNGLITSARWRTEKANGVSGSDLTGMYIYTYDDQYQIKDASFAKVNYGTNTFTVQDNQFRLTNMKYDPNGNIKNLKRYNDVGAVIHNFTYSYDGNTNKLASVNGYTNAYKYDAIGQMIGEDKDDDTADQYVEYDVTGKVRKVFSNPPPDGFPGTPPVGDPENPDDDQEPYVQQLKVEYLYDDRGFRLAKIVYPKADAEDGKIRTTWYIRDGSGNVLNVFEQEGAPAEANTNPLVLTEVPLYGSGKLGTYYPAQDKSINYEITDHLSNVRALVRENIITYTATMEDNGHEELTNPRVQEINYFDNIFETEDDNIHMNHTASMPGIVDVPDKSSLLYWIDGMMESSPSEKSIGPAISLRVKAGDTIRAEVWTRYEIKPVGYTALPLATFASLLATAYTGAIGLDGIPISHASQTFSNALAGIFTEDSDDERPYAHLNYILLNGNLEKLRAKSEQVPEEAGFVAGEESFGDPVMLSLTEPVIASEDGYIYVWVSNASENSRVWFDDLKVTHSSAIFVSQATDYGVWGDILREQKTDESVYRYSYQGQFSEKDLETGWNHFELREFDVIIGRWITTDIFEEYWSPYVGMGNNPVNGIDPDGGDNKPINFRDCLECLGKGKILDPVVVTADWDGDYSSILGQMTIDPSVFLPAPSPYVQAIRDFDVAHPGDDLIMKDLEMLAGDVSIGGMGGGIRLIQAARAMRAAKAIRAAKVAKAARAANALKKTLPAWKTIAVDIEHIASGHMHGGSRVSSLKTLFPQGMTKDQVHKMVRSAYRNVHKKLLTQGDRILLRGSSNGTTIEMWLNKATKTIETAYPIH